MIVLRILFLTFSLCAASSIFAQNTKTVRDFGTWIGMAIETDFSKKWKGIANQELRSFKNSSEVRKSITEFGLSYDINKLFELEGGLRYDYRQEKDKNFSHNIRYNIDFKYKHSLANKMRLQYRFRFQSNFESPFTGFSDFRQRDKSRHRLKLDLDKKKHKVYISSEIFKERVYYRKASFEKLRFTLGDKFKIRKSEVNVGFGYEVEIFEDAPLNFFFARLYYTFQL